MKTLNNFIIERLKLNKNTKINYKEWSIEDAKDGDIITVKEDTVTYIFIFKEIRNNEILFYCCYDPDYDNFDIPRNGEFMGNKENAKWSAIYYQSSKKEKKMLFDSMKKSGCKWDANKKQLKWL